MTQSEALLLAKKSGFTNYGFFNTSDITPLKAVRDMCSENKCKKYGKCWTCPPACGSLDFFQKKIRSFSWGILLQTTSKMQDDFDIETITSAEKDLKHCFELFCDKLRSLNERCMPLSAGACTLCSECSYPDSPCRFPDKAFPSIEAAGLLVSDICSAAEIPYYYGEKTITFCACVLF